MEPDEMAPNTVREVRLAREHFARGYVHAEKRYVASARTIDIAREEAKLHYPLPTVEVPRVVSVCGTEYRVFNGALEYRCPGEEQWYNGQQFIERTKVINDLLASPTERVEVTP